MSNVYILYELIMVKCYFHLKPALFTIFPLSSCVMDKTKQFISVYCLWIEVIPHRLLL